MDNEDSLEQATDKYLEEEMFRELPEATYPVSNNTPVHTSPPSGARLLLESTPRRHFDYRPSRRNHNYIPGMQ